MFNLHAPFVLSIGLFKVVHASFLIHFSHLAFRFPSLPLLSWVFSLLHFKYVYGARRALYIWVYQDSLLYNIYFLDDIWVFMTTFPNLYFLPSFLYKTWISNCNYSFCIHLADILSLISLRLRSGLSPAHPPELVPMWLLDFCCWWLCSLKQSAPNLGIFYSWECCQDISASSHTSLHNLPWYYCT